MDSRVTLALMAKAKLVFEQPNTVLSFPVPPFALSIGEMRAVAGDVSNASDASAAFEFARLVNQCPTVPVWTATADRMLWSVYDDILHRSGEVARGERSGADKAAFQAAEQVLFSVDDQGLRVPSEHAKAYAQYRDTWFTLQQAYRARKVAAESPAADDATRAAWSRDEPALRAEITTLETDWRDRGFRDEIESAQATIGAIAAKDPVLQWDRWSRNFDFFLDSRVDLASQAAFCPTTYSPSDVVDSSGWIDFHLAGAEVEQLIKEAPGDLRSRLDQPSAATTISKVSFACTTVGVKRPWADEGVFAARIWRFADQTRRLSDGGSPPRGEWPYYVAGLVLARNVAVVTSTPQPDPVTPTPQPGSGPVVRDHRGGGGAAGGVTVRPGPAEGLGRPVVRDHRTFAPAAAPAVAFAAPPAAAGAPAMARLAAGPEGRFDQRLVVADRQVTMPSASTMAILRATQVRRLDRPIAAVAGLAQAAGAPASLTDEVMFLAFICKPLPVCPNPDLALFGK
jgi:hypothetical protein